MFFKQENIARHPNEVASFYTGPENIVFMIILIWVQMFYLCYSYFAVNIIDDMIVPDKNFKLENVFWTTQFTC